MDLKVNGVTIFDQGVLSPNRSYLLGFGVSIGGIGLMWPLKVSLLSSFKSQLVVSKLAKFKLVHAERMRVRCFNAFCLSFSPWENLEEAVLSVQWVAVFSVPSELLDVYEDDRG